MALINFVGLQPCHRRSQRGPEGPSPSPLPPANEKNIKASLVNLNMRYKNDKKISNLSSTDSFFFQAQNAPKSVFQPGLRPGPRWGSLRYDAPPDP